MKLTIDEIRRTLEGIIRARSSLSNEEVRWVADDYLEGELQGKLTHELLAFQIHHTNANRTKCLRSKF